MKTHSCFGGFPSSVILQKLVISTRWQGLRPTSAIWGFSRACSRVGPNPCRLVFSGASQLENFVSLSFFLPPLCFDPVSLAIWEELFDGVTSSSRTWPRTCCLIHAPLTTQGYRGGCPWSRRAAGLFRQSPSAGCLFETLVVILEVC